MAAPTGALPPATTDVHSGEIAALQHLRGFAALGVVLYHVSAMSAFPKYFGRHFSPDPLQYGAVGVDVFFLISGFIISITSLNSGLAPRRSVGSFASKRFARIIPLMWLSIASYAALRLIGRGGDIDLWSYLRASVLWPAGELEPKVIWTLRHELIFYAVFAVAFLGKKPLRPLLYLWFAAPVLYELAGLPAAPTSSLGEALRTIANPVNLEFAAGFLIGVLWLRRTRSWSIDFGPFSPFFVLLVLMIALVLSLRLGGAGIHDTSLLAALTAAMAFPIVFLAVHARSRPGLFETVGRYLGAASYSIYLFHAHIISAVLGAWSHRAHGTPLILVILGGAVFATVGGVAIYRFAEIPLVSAAQRLIRGRSDVHPAPAPLP